MSSFESVELDDFDKVLGTTSTEVSSVALGGKILSCSDEWFAPASDLLKVGPAPSMKGQFGPKGALFDGWETRRHNPTYDWVILRLGPAAGSSITGFDVDTANFNGNEAPEVEIYGLRLSAEEEKASSKVSEQDVRWTPLLHRVACKPSSRHLYTISSSASHSSSPIFTHIKLHMIPDGGIARFRVYGMIPPPPLGLGVDEFATSGEDNPAMNALDLAHVLNGGRVVFTSDQHFGIGPNVLLPGRGKDMGDGWETKRSRQPGHKDWLIIKLGEPGLLSYAEIDTNHFLGNFPESVELHAILIDGEKLPNETSEWTPILPRSKTGPGKQHYFPLINVKGIPYSHVRVTMHPDGGIKRVRIVGRRSGPLQQNTEDLSTIPVPEKGLPILPSKGLNGLTTAIGNFFHPSTPSTSAHGFLGPRNVSHTSAPLTLQAAPLSFSNFADYGEVIAQAADRPSKSVNQGTAQKYERLSDLVSSYPTSAQAKPSLHVYRCQGVELSEFQVKVLERHQFTKQAFLPLSKGRGANQKGYLVIVAKNGSDDLPDLTTLAAFTATSEQGIAYGAGVWHHPMIALGSDPTDFAVVVYESASEATMNCDEVFYDRSVATIEL